MPPIPGSLGEEMEGMAPILHVASARASIEWYARLGCEVESEHIVRPDWPLYVRGPAQLHLSEHRLDGGPATQVYLYVEDVHTASSLQKPERPQNRRPAPLDTGPFLQG
jgi:Glyoxalase superfamily protein